MLHKLLMPFVFHAALAATLQAAATCPELQGRWGYGPADAVAMAGTRAYVGSGSVLLIADLANPASVPVVGRLLLPDGIRGVAAAGAYVYVGANQSGLRVVDVSDPAAPVEVGHFDTGSYAVGVAVSGHHVYLADGWDGLRVFDVTDPANPIEVGVFDTPMFARDVAIAGDLAYVVDAEAGLFVLDVSSPAAPSLVGSLALTGQSLGVALSAGHALIASSAGLRVIDVGTPASPVEIVTYEPPCGAALSDVAVAGTFVYGGNGGCGVSVIDLSSPSAPVEAARLDTAGSAEAVAAAGTVLVVADGSGGVAIADISAPATPAATSSIALPDSTFAVALDGGHAFLANSAGGLRVIDIGDPANPVEVASLGLPAAASAIAIADHFAYLTSNGAGLHVVDVSDPGAPSLVGGALFAGSTSDLAVEAGFAYLARGTEGLAVFDVSDPADPTATGTLPLPGGNADRIAVSGTHAFVADSATGLRIIDIANPAAPAQVGFLPVSGGARAVAVVGTLAYAGDSARHMLVVDVSNPATPIVVATAPINADPVDLTVDGDFLLAANGNSGVSVMSLAIPAQPELVGEADTPGQAWGIAAAAGRVVASDFSVGAAVFDTSTCPLTACSLSCDATATPGAGLPPLSVAFDVEVVAAGCGDGTTYDWSFGDGSAHASEQRPTHAFAAVGGYPWSVVAAIGGHQVTCSGTVTVAGPPPRHFDFGTPASALAAGYTRVSHNTTFDPAAGFGWSSGALASRDRSTGPDLTRDFVFTADAVFDVFAPAAWYDVSVTIGDATVRHDEVGVFLEGIQAGVVTTAAGQFVTRTYRAYVGDGTLSVGIRDLGGSDPNAVVNALTVDAAAPRRFDFGTPTSPVGAGWTQVTHATPYTERQGYGWLAGAIGSRDRGAGSALERDLAFTPQGTFAADVANGMYDVVVTVGDAAARHDQMGLFLEGALVATVTTAPGAFTTRSFRVSVVDGQLSVGLEDLGGSDPNVVINALAVYGSSAGAPGALPSAEVPRNILDLQTATSTIDVESVPGSIADVDVTLDVTHSYDRDVRAVLIAPDGTHVTLFEEVGGGGDDFAQTTLDDEAATPVTLGTAPFAGTYRPASPLGALDGKDPNGVWTLEVTDTADRDEGTLNSWSLTIVTELGPQPRRFDFGTPTSPLASTFTRVAHTTAYAPALGHGWLSGPINSRDRNAGGDINRDFCFTPMGTFVVDLPTGTYDVTLVSGDAAARHDQMAFEVEGVVAAVVTAIVGQFPVTTVRRQVTDGQLTVLLKDNGGSDANVVINALEVVPVAP